MEAYLNKATKQIIVSLAGCVGFADKLLECDFRGSDHAKEDLRLMKEAAGRVMDFVMEGIDQDHVRAVLRYADACQLMVIPSTNPQTQREYYIVPDTAMNVFLKQATGDCFLCDKEGKECRKCEIRKALLDSMVLGINDRGDCPYKDY